MLEDGTLDKKQVTTFIKENSLELIIPFNEEVTNKYTSKHTRVHKIKIAWKVILK